LGRAAKAVGKVGLKGEDHPFQIRLGHPEAVAGSQSRKHGPVAEIPLI
jgi:hypothetical protein